MKQIPWASFSTFMSGIGEMHGRLDPNDVMLFRGQAVGDPLLPKIARADPRFDSTQLEREMLTALRRQGRMFPAIDDAKTDLELLSIAQHHGMSTRLLDWSSNPLVGLWFACSEHATDKPGHLYMYRAGRDVVLDPAVNEDPFSYPVTRIFEPPFNSARLVAQSGWFSVHPYYARDKFKGLDEDVMHTLWVWHLAIPAAEKAAVLKALNGFGINHRSLFPDLDGLCSHISWEHTTARH